MFKIKAFSPTTLTVIMDNDFKTVILKAGDFCFSEITTSQIEQQRRNKIISVKQASQRDLELLKADKEVEVVNISNAKYFEAQNKKVEEKDSKPVEDVKAPETVKNDKPQEPVKNQSSANQSSNSNKKNSKSDEVKDSDSENLIGKEGKE